MTTDDQLLILAQWLSPAYPLGAFAWSQGLETAIAEGHVRDADTLGEWIEDVLRDGAGRADAILMRLAFDAEAGALEALNDTARAFAPSHERLEESARQGAAFCKATAAIWHIDLPPMLLPVALGRAARLVGLDIDRAVAFFLQAQASTLVSAAQRLMPLGQTPAQGVLAGLRSLCVALVDATRDTTEDDLYSAAYLADIASMRHETLSPRLFQS